MTHKHIHTVASIAIFTWGSVFFAFTLFSALGKTSVEPVTVTTAFHQSAAASPEADSSSLRRAQRARERMFESPHIIGTSAFDDALRERSDLLSRSVTVRFVRKDDPAALPVEWTVSLADHAEWIDMDAGWMGVDTHLNEDLIAEYVESNIIGLPLATSGIVTKVMQDKKVLRTDIGHIVQDGFTLDADTFASTLAQAFETGLSSIVLESEYTPAIVQVQVGGESHTLERLAAGLSNFEKSPANREINVHKALDEHVNNVFVPAGSTFSFNDTLGGPVTLDKGWVEALGLFGGGAALTPGGGICQAATTVYRAAVLAGLPIVEKRNHSLYVSYYEKYGVGMDATIFPGIHDLVFLNDTGAPLLIQARTEGKDAYVEVFGVNDGRVVNVEGPFFAGSKNRPKGIRGLGYDEIGWLQSVTYADGRTRMHPLISRYHKGIPGSLARTYGNEQGNEQLHAAASQN